MRPSPVFFTSVPPRSRTALRRSVKRSRRTSADAASTSAVRAVDSTMSVNMIVTVPMLERSRVSTPPVVV